MMPNLSKGNEAGMFLQNDDKNGYGIIFNIRQAKTKLCIETIFLTKRANELLVHLSYCKKDPKNMSKL